MKRTEYAAGIDSLPNDLLDPRERDVRSHTRPRRGHRLDWWASGSTVVIGLGMLASAIMAFTSQTEAINDGGEPPAVVSKDLALAEEFVITPSETAVAKEEAVVVSETPDEGVPEIFAAAPTHTISEDAIVKQALTEPKAIAPQPVRISEPSVNLDDEAVRLNALPPASLRFDSEPLDIAIAMIADSAGMSYATNGVLEGSVTGSLVGNPYRLLRNLAKAYSFEMEYYNGLWTFSSSRKPAKKISPSSSPSQSPVMTRTYSINSNMLERLKISQGIGGERSLGAAGAGGRSEMSSANLLAGRTVFEADYSRLVQDLQQLLQGAHPESKGYVASVFLNEDGNSLLAVGTASDHKLISAYLGNFDKPQRAIALEVKLVRTKRNPSSLVGVDWSKGLSFDLSGTFDEGKVSLDRLVGGLGGSPTGVLLTNSQATVTLDAIKHDAMTKRISYIEKMTLDNREVVLSNVVEEPVIGDREEIDSESGLRVLLTIEKEIIGTVINILPRILPDDTVKMRLRLEDSNIVRFKQFFEDSTGGEYPVISKQTYEGPVVIKDGYSLAITGFETTEEVVSSSRVPVLGKLPLVGKAFGRDKTQEERSYLVIFITPRILPDSSTGIDYAERGHHLGRSEPLGPINGTQFASFRDLERYVSGIRRQHDELMQLVDLRGATSEVIADAGFLYGELEALAEKLQGFYDQGIERQKASTMLDFCEAAIINTWRLIQQDTPSMASSPTDLIKASPQRAASSYQVSKDGFKNKRREQSFKRYAGRRRGR